MNSKYYLPFSGEKPAVIDVKGHRLLIASTDPEELCKHLNELGGDRIEPIPEEVDKEKYLESLAQKVKSGIIIAPDDIDLSDVLKVLEIELPWLQ